MSLPSLSMKVIDAQLAKRKEKFACAEAFIHKSAS